MHPVRNGSGTTRSDRAGAHHHAEAGVTRLVDSDADRTETSDTRQPLQLAADPCQTIDAGIRTLLFEEDVVKLRFVERILRSRGHFVTACTSADAVLLTFQDAEYPLVVLGGAFARARALCLRLQASGTRPSVYVVIGWRDKPGEMKAALASGADEYLPDPTDVALFNVRLTSVERRVDALRDHDSGSPVHDDRAAEEIDLHDALNVPSAEEQEHDMKLDILDQTLHSENTARREAEGALVNIRGEMERRISLHLVERRTLVDTLHLETEARKDAEHALREARMELNHRLDQHFTALAAIGTAAQVEANARLEAEIALREVRGELQRRVDLHALEMRQTCERVQQEIAARKEAESTLRHTRGNVRRRTTAHRAELQTLHGELERERAARSSAEASVPSGPSEPEQRIEALAAEVRALTAQIEHETTHRKQAETRLHEARVELERRVDAHAQDRRALTEALEREKIQRQEQEHSLDTQQAERAGAHAAQIHALTTAVEQETARRERAEAALRSATAAGHADGDELLAAVRRHLRVVSNAALTVATTAAQRTFLHELTENAEATLPTDRPHGPADGAANGGSPASARHAMTAFRFRDTVRDVLEPLGHRAREQGLQLAWHVGQQVPDEVTGSPVYLRQVLFNLADNAIRFTREGEVTVRIDAASWTPGRVVLLATIADSGGGIDVAHQERVFDLLARGDDLLARPAASGGLGLAVSAHLVRAMGGRIWFESEPDMGSTFYFTTPLAARDAAGVTPSTSTSANPRRAAGDPTKPCVLVADDTPEDQALAARVLEGHGYRVVAVRDGREALAALEEEPVDLALTDLRMPRMDGFELAAAIRTAESDSTGGRGAIPIVALAVGSGGVADRERCAAVGIDRCVTKPVQATDLLSAVEQALSQR